MVELAASKARDTAISLEISRYRVDVRFLDKALDNAVRGEVENFVCGALGHDAGIFEAVELDARIDPEQPDRADLLAALRDHAVARDRRWAGCGIERERREPGIETG